MSRFRNHSTSKHLRTGKFATSKKLSSWRASKKAPARQQPFQQKCNAPLPTDAFFGLCWLDVICITVLLHTHTHCCRKVIFVIFIIYTISCRKTIIRTKSIRLKKCCETLLTGDKIDLLCWFMKKNFSVENGYFHHRHHVLSGTTLMYSSYVSGWTTGSHHAGQPGAKRYQL